MSIFNKTKNKKDDSIELNMSNLDQYINSRKEYTIDSYHQSPDSISVVESRYIDIKNYKPL